MSILVKERNTEKAIFRSPRNNRFLEVSKMMVSKFETFYAKILLFGEYSLMYGSAALSIPFRQKHVKLLYPATNLSPFETTTAYSSNNHLKNYLQFLISTKTKPDTGINLEKMQHDLDQGLYLKSTIPTGYGLGSSGALVAALFHEYGSHHKDATNMLNHDQLYELKQIFAFMESFFHGSSSGLDPLSIYVKKPLLINRHEKISVIYSELLERQDIGSFFLLDTRIQRKTRPLVNVFKKKYTAPEFRTMIHTDYVAACNNCIDALLTGNGDFHGFLHRLSDMQLRYFKEMIPAGLQPMWAKGLSSGLFTPKLCGAGGGGYLLCYSEDTDKALEALSSKKNDILPIY